MAGVPVVTKRRPSENRATLVGWKTRLVSRLEIMKMSKKRRRKPAKRPVSKQTSSDKATKAPVHQAPWYAGPLQVMAGVGGFIAGAWVMFSAWVSMTNEFAWKLGALEEGPFLLVLAQLSGFAHFAMLTAGLGCGLWGALIMRSRLVLGLEMESTKIRVLIIIASILCVVAAGTYVFALGIVA